MRILFGRHGQTNQLPGYFDGLGSPRLDEVGRDQRRQLSQFAIENGINLVVTSEAPRTKQTARPLTKSAGITHLTAPGTGEVHWAGLSGKLIAAHFTSQESARADRQGWDYLATRGADTRRMAGRQLGAVVEQLTSKYPNYRVLFIGHGMKTRCFIGQAAGMTAVEAMAIPFDNASVLEYDTYHPSRFRPFSRPYPM